MTDFYIWMCSLFVLVAHISEDLFNKDKEMY